MKIFDLRILIPMTELKVIGKVCTSNLINIFCLNRYSARNQEHL